MAESDVIMPQERSDALPVVRSIGVTDLKEVLSRGVDDFLAMPTHVIVLCLIYPVAGILLGAVALGYDFIPLLFPLAAGFALVGPFAAIGLYELSRRREMGMDTSWRHAFDVIHSPSLPALAAVGLLLVVIFAVWVACAQAIYIGSFGYALIDSPLAFVRRVLTTSEGWSLIVVGNLVGFVFAVIAATISVVSIPLLLDRNVGFAVAIATSIKAVIRNPAAMAAWGLIVAGGLILGSLPFFVGLAIALPVLGHSTWHLYRKVIEPDAHARPEYHPREKTPVYAAEFPASLFALFFRKKGD